MKKKMIKAKVVSDNDTDKKKSKKKQKNKKKKQYNKEVMRISLIFFLLFFSLGFYLFYFNVFLSEDVVNNTYNARQTTFAESVVRGTIYSSDMEALAYTETDDDGNETRVYPYGELFAHVVGYNTNGMLGIELDYNYNLLTSNANLFERIVNELQGEKNIGDNVITTLDVDIQQIAYDALGDYDGAVIVLDPETGEILAMVSKPDFDPNTIEDEWDEITAEDEIGEESGVLVNRATQGLYAPGSTFKIFTLLEYIKENPDDYENYSYICTGSITVDGYSLSCYGGESHGTESLIESFANSCNSSFANIGLTLDLDSFAELTESLLFNSELTVDFEYNESSYTLDSDSTVFEIMQTSIGQGETQVTPLHLALVMSAIANDGVLVEPYLVDHTENYEGELVEEYGSEDSETLFTSDETEILNEYLRAVVTDGTASELNSDLYTAYGKTGTAETSENEDDGDNKWFVGYATDGDKTLVVCAITEDVTDSNNYSVDAAKNIFDYYFSD